MKQIFSVCAAFLTLAPFSFSQINYVTEQTATGKAKSAYKAGMEHVNAREYDIALGYFEKALKEEPRFIDANLQLAETYIDLRDFFKAEKYFEEALALDVSYWPVAYYRLALVEWTLDKYGEAADHAELFLKSQPQDSKTRREAEELLASARFVVEAMKNPLPFSPQSVGNGINSANNEYLPCLTADGETMIFTRDDIRSSPIGNGRDENFYISRFKDGAWQKAEPLEGVNTPYDEGAQSISPDGTWLVYTACGRRDDGSQGKCDLYWSQLKNAAWTKPSPFSSTINSKDWEAQPCISADGKSIIFASDRAGGHGRADLWITTRQPNGKWTTPQNAGAEVNTSGQEECPFLHPDGQTLYFASDGHPGMGNFDFYFSRKNPDGTWGKPQNLGYPINTKAQEKSLVVSLDGRAAYFAADRPGGQGGIDIYQFELPAHARPQPVTYARAQVKDAATGYPIVAKVDFTDLKTGQSFVSANTKSDGSFLVCLPAGKDYALNVSKDKYLFYSENFNLTETATFEKPFLLNIELQPISDESAAIASSKPVVLRNVFFETGSAALRPESSAELDRLAALLTDVPMLKIQINGHTDNTGDDASNQRLSEARAKAVYEYLIAKNIAGERLKFKGFGEVQPVEPNDTAEGRGRNRRTEFVVW